MWGAGAVLISRSVDTDWRRPPVSWSFGSSVSYPNVKGWCEIAVEQVNPQARFPNTNLLDTLVFPPEAASLIGYEVRSARTLCWS